jgi:serine/threonine protein phosphatase 1
MKGSKPVGSAYTFAVGDVHGCDASLARLLKVCNDWGGNCLRRFVFLGDYVDRGPASAAVLRRLMSWEEKCPDQVLCLRGNHEEMLLRACQDPTAHSDWLLNGGLNTLRSFRVPRAKDIPQEVIEWLRRLSATFDDGRRFFVHAGVDLTCPLDRQLPEVLTWMREPFLTLADSVDPGRLIVHGHTPVHTRRPDLRRHRVNLDTGACLGGPLTAAVFSDSETGPICFITDSGERIAPLTTAPEPSDSQMSADHKIQF